MLIGRGSHGAYVNKRQLYISHERKMWNPLEGPTIYKSPGAGPGIGEGCRSAGIDFNLCGSS